MPQGSILGPLIWNLGYDPVLGAAVADGAEVIAYADDTLIIIEGSSWTCTLRGMEAAVAAVTGEIRKLGITVATNKTEAIWFHNLPQNRKPPSTWLCVGRNRIRVGQNLKYLGITLDERLGFKTHLETLRVKIARNASYFGRILPNMIGPGYRIRKLHANVLNSMVMYIPDMDQIYNKKRGSHIKLHAASYGPEDCSSV
ncbi:hypothetical protein QLX08_009336 [Tetragonisca angustula]|uniref:Reverse transcriptase domain-containing protein n=1 Tax=Tetragonisca angustula TaxID=166442 RepID=A0AAW0ZG76_9HYME